MVDTQMMDVTPSWDTLSQLPTEQKFVQIRRLRNLVIGSSKEKDIVFQTDVLSTLLSIVACDEESIETRRIACDVLGSIAKGTRGQVARLVAGGTVHVLFNAISSMDDLLLIESCLRCLRCIFASDLAPTNTIYENEDITPCLLKVLNLSMCTQQCVTVILARSCLTEEHQTLLCKSGLIDTVLPLLFAKLEVVHLPAINLLTSLVKRNENALSVLLSVKIEPSVFKRMAGFLTVDNSVKVQLAAAKFLTYSCSLKAIDVADPLITLKVLPTLTRCIQEDSVRSSTALRIEACRTLTVLLQLDAELQKISSYSHHCLQTLRKCLRPGKLRPVGNNVAELECAAMHTLAAVTLNDEDIRRKVSGEVGELIDCVVTALHDDPHSMRALAAATVVHSMSRSVEQLRTTFQDKCICPALMQMVNSNHYQTACVASAALANLAIEFSPCRKELVDADIINVFIDMALKEETNFRLNGVWGLMNLAYGTDERVKLKILKSLGAKELLDLLPDPCTDSPLTIRLLGLIRNLLAINQDCALWNIHMDTVMSTHGTSIMQLIVYVLENDYDTEAKQMAICILSNIAAGDNSKQFIMDNEDVLRKVTNYMMSNKPRLQVAATLCINNLVWKADKGSLGRQSKLRELGVHKLLQSMQNTSDTTLYDKVKLTNKQFE